MIYRLYSPEDFGALYAIEELCFQPRFRFDDEYMRSLVDASNAATWVAEEDGAMAGFSIVDWNRESGGLIAYIQTIEVTPGQRGRGVGRELLANAEGSARAAGARMVWLHVDEQNKHAVRLYEANGYSFAGRHENYYAQDRAALIYYKALNRGSDPHRGPNSSKN